MTAVHPLDPATAEELEQAIARFREAHGRDAWFASGTRNEPAKTCADDAQRVIRLIGVDGDKDGGFEADVSLTTGDVSVRRVAPEAQTHYGFKDFSLAVYLTRSNSEWQAAMRKRGVAVESEEDLELIQIDPWPGAGYLHPSVPTGHRAFRCIAFVREDKTDNGYARPVQGLIAHVDVTDGRVVAVEDHGVVPLPRESGRYDAGLHGTREGIRELAITQPDGPGFEVDGYRIRWQGYDVRVSIHPIHGLVLHQLSLNERPILHRASLSDMVVPYGDSDPMHTWKHVLDASEIGLGSSVNSLALGCDCVGEIYYFDVDHVTWEGKVKCVKNAICLHEEDYGIQWKHHNAEAQTTEVRRSRRLVISSVFTIGNYDYGFYWYLYLDGTIQMEIKLTGIVGVSAVAGPGAPNPQQAPLIAPNIVSPVHQHLFCFRLDWELDGGPNALYETNVEALPISEDNPDGTQFRAVPTHLTRESAAKRETSPHTSRSWKVVNPDSTNGLGEPVAYKLLPGPSPLLIANPDSAMAKRAAFATHHLWATEFAEGEQYAAGPHTVMHPGGGLPDYTAGDRDISKCDLVMWHTVGVTHVPRPEDWPVMPVEYCGFHLVPVGFFDKNPTLDLPSHCHAD